MLKRYLKNEEGSTAAVFALAIPMFIGGIALAVELGHWHQNKSKLQELADSTAFAAAQEIKILREDAKYEYAGMGHAYENGFDYNNGDVVVISPPLSGRFAGRDDAVEVELNQLQKTYFSRYFGNKTFDMATRATAIVLEGRPVCVLAINPTAPAAIDMGGNASISMQNCALHSNSSAPNSVLVGNNTTIEAECLSSAGGIDATGTMTMACDDQTDPFSGRTPDPFRNTVIADDVSSLPCSSATRQGQNQFLSMEPGQNVRRICQNVRTNGLIEFLDPGTYYFDGVQLETDGNNSLIFGRDVTLVFLNGGTLMGANAGNINLTPQTSGDYAGMAMFFDPETTTQTNLTINGNANTLIEGVIYAPSMDIQINGGANVSSRCTLVVGNTVDIRGNAGFSNTDCEALGIEPMTSLSGVLLIE